MPFGHQLSTNLAPSNPSNPSNTTVFIGLYDVSQMPSCTTLGEFLMPKSLQNDPKGLQGEPKGSQKSPRWSPKTSKWTPMTSKMTQKGSTVCPKASKVSQKPLKVTYKIETNTQPNNTNSAKLDPFSLQSLVTSKPLSIQTSRLERSAQPVN